jgi:iron complex transport system substrate-binding protein
LFGNLGLCTQNFARRWKTVVFLLAATVPVNAQATPARVFTDDTGRLVPVPVEVRRIVSLAPSVTETLFALGLGDRVVGVTDYCNYPAAALQRTKVGTPLSPSLEVIVSLHPDLVVAAKSANRRETLGELDRLGIPAYATDAKSLEDIFSSTERLATAAGVPEAGRALAAALRARLLALQQRLAGRAPKRVLLVVWHEPLISVGQHTFIADALRYAGATHILETAQDWPRLSLEAVVRLQPDYLIFAGDHAAAMHAVAKTLAEQPGWRQLTAVRQQRTIVLDEAINRPSPRLLDAIEDLARQLHPQAFQQAVPDLPKVER